MAWGRGAKAEAAPAYITKVSAEGLAAIIREAGFKAVVEQGKDGFPYILSASNGWNYIIRFFNKVGTFQFTLWLKDKDSRISLARMNEFNARWRFVEASWTRATKASRCRRLRPGRRRLAGLSGQPDHALGCADR
jgi:hypothetical protein